MVDKPLRFSRIQIFRNPWSLQVSIAENAIP
jgi:hypothetical protein